MSYHPGEELPDVFETTIRLLDAIRTAQLTYDDLWDPYRIAHEGPSDLRTEAEVMAPVFDAIADLGALTSVGRARLQDWST